MDNLLLSNCQLDKIYTIQQISIQNKNIKRRFLELGILPNKKIKVVKKSALKKVLLIELDGLKLAIRSAFANDISVR